MMITVWSKQHKNAYKELIDTGLLITRKRFAGKDLDEQGHLIRPCYDWLAQNHPQKGLRPKEADYPIWVSYSLEATMLKDENSVVLELSIPKNLITPIHVAKWGTILNYGYIPLNEADSHRHQQLLADYATSDAKAFMSEFYPQIKREIINSWDRLFDTNITMDSQTYYGTLWYLKKEWLLKTH